MDTSLAIKNNASDGAKTYPREEVVKATTEYFGGDELAANVWVNKYALQEDRKSTRLNSSHYS